MVDAAVLGLITAALVWDIKERRIPNVLTLPAMGVGLVYGAALGGFGELVLSAQGLLLGAGLFIIPFAFGGLGGGDVKLMAAIGALKGWLFVLHAVLLTAIWGGLIALAAVLITRRFHVLRDFLIGLGLFVRTGGRVGLGAVLPASDNPAEEKRLVVPYGTAIFAGTVTAYFVSLNIPG